jgi:hypothetical protein
VAGARWSRNLYQECISKVREFETAECIAGCETLRCLEVVLNTAASVEGYHNGPKDPYDSAGRTLKTIEESVGVHTPLGKCNSEPENAPIQFD